MKTNNPTRSSQLHFDFEAEDSRKIQKIRLSLIIKKKKTVGYAWARIQQVLFLCDFLNRIGKTELFRINVNQPFK